MKVSEQHEMMFKLYHGHEGSEGISNVDLMCKGLSPFDDLFDDAGFSNVTDPNATEASSMKELKQLYTRKLERYILGIDINPNILAQRDYTNKSLVTGRQLFDMHG